MMRSSVVATLLVFCLTVPMAACAQSGSSTSNRSTSTAAPVLKKLGQMCYVGYSARTSRQKERDASTAKIPSLWSDFHMDNLRGQVKNQTNPPAILGVYSDYQSNDSGLYTVTAACQVVPSKTTPSLPEGTKYGVIPPQTYLMFAAKGSRPASIVNTWSAIWKYFGENKKYKRTFKKDFELYKSDQLVEIYVAVQ